ncbi:TPA: EamA family transporter [Candidatus Wolfebacteria bacterium]|nr:EamA family transporter [Candidatus Wolfebacteria bacterium]HAS95407.1 EamA family transporter [Candidatus Wolfebacteria bacterium]HBD17841.1 EamA family transporter [Candidatus Wolfebacteria bacterium]HBN87411.1 EamA family transporter [Candidatus Wolfebacteria bacterium]HBT75123.1 EamA family transporter [Candidatus Wolfebacteria bacterium]
MLTTMWIIYAVLAAITAAGVAIFAKLGLRQIDVVLATTIRALIMAGFLVVASLFLKKFDGFSPSSWSGREWGLIALAGLSGAISWLFYFMALRSADASRVAAIDRTSLVFVALLAALFLGEQLKIKAILGIVLMVIGAVLMV